jgi:hypothetical protein
MKDLSAIVPNGAKVTILEKAFPYKRSEILKYREIAVVL